MPRVDAIIFDKDGTLFSFQATWSSWADGLLSELAGEDLLLAARIATAIGYDQSRRAFRPESVVIADTPDAIAATIFDVLPGIGNLASLADRINSLAASTCMVEAVPLAPFFADLTRRGLKLGIATNDAEAPAIAHLREAGVEGYFDFVAGYDSGHGAKPGPGQLLAFARHTGHAPQRIAMVGDSAHDLIAANEAGMIGLAVLTGVASEDDLAPLASAVLPDIGHLPAWLDGI